MLSVCRGLGEVRDLWASCRFWSNRRQKENIAGGCSKFEWRGLQRVLLLIPRAPPSIITIASALIHLLLLEHEAIAIHRSRPVVLSSTAA